MADDPAAVIAKSLDTTNQLISGTISVVAALMSAIERRDPRIKDDLIEVIEGLLDGMTTEERDSPNALPLRCLRDFCQTPDADISQLLH